MNRYTSIYLYLILKNRFILHSLLFSEFVHKYSYVGDHIYSFLTTIEM